MSRIQIGPGVHSRLVEGTGSCMDTIGASRANATANAIACNQLEVATMLPPRCLDAMASSKFNAIARNQLDGGAVLPATGLADNGREDHPLEEGGPDSFASLWLTCGHSVLKNVVTWNTAGLLHHDERSFVARAKVLSSLIGAGILCLQETHGGGAAEALLNDDFYTFSSQHELRPTAAGGVLLAIRRSLFPQCFITHHVLLAGRIIACRVYMQNCVLLVLGVHLVDDKTVDASWTQSVALVGQYIQKWSLGPVLLLGDVNFQIGPDE
eukprot:6479100-Amphidinium_carterae.1